MRLRLVILSVAVVVVAGLAVALSARPSQPSLVVVDGFVIGPDRTCADLGLPQLRCDGLVARALAANQGGTAHSLHNLGEIVTNGVTAVPSWGDGSPFGLLVIEYPNGTMSAVPLGCFGPPGLASPADPLCP
ncbi:MAG: hypothetical protein ACRDGQ_04905 [Candidatus Limnocylindrales bacterium]